MREWPSAGHRLAPYRSSEFSRTWRRRCSRSLPRADVAGRRRYKRRPARHPDHLRLYCIAVAGGAVSAWPSRSLPGRTPLDRHRDPTACNASVGLRLLTRSAINTYFAHVARVLSLPQSVDELARRIETFWSVLEHASRSMMLVRRAGLIRRCGQACKNIQTT